MGNKAEGRGQKAEVGKNLKKVEVRDSKTSFEC
jgi:hypothetical protein